LRGGEGAAQNRQVASTRDASALDRVDKAIIEQLQQDGRRPYTHIAREVGLSEAAVRQRVQRLIDDDVMQIVAVTDPFKIGFGRQAMIGVRVDGDIMTAADALASLDEVEYVVITAGSLDLLVEVVVEDDDRLLSLLNDKIRRIEGVHVTESFIYLRIHKETYQFGTR
jgi:Lrp/AsnC family transcriptional regulator, regulator for asnA, asnC and gidA